MTSLNEQPSAPSQAEEKLALHYLERPAKKESGKRRALILLHGVGSNEQDLFGLAPHLPDDLLVISPRGPFSLGAGRYAWYEVDFSTGKPVFNASQEAQSRELILQFVRQVKQKYKLDEVYLGGFSQGGIMSYSIGLTHPTEVTGIISLSGRLLTEIRPSVKPGKELKNLKVFIAHGKQDGTLPVHYAREASAYIQSLGIQPTYHEFEMGHQINNQVLDELVKWLQK
ncbi:alpha/beta hydrolase [Adhaeribacter soli]|uniref:Alpha/beta fold hydrolase n=1 Tax=Adhaeribacter soli TaxID=2607655 RepID=A0A5N1J719_9BACT|nr:alpha/beta fold hydrolase [Adhaeribacter soli]KAA9345762.1 alpha/beta fold hydrolase [Adhaeribacter soli]